MPGRKWLWFGLLVEATKPIVGVTFGLVAVANTVHDAVSEIHGDLTQHYNYVRGQEIFREEVALALEQIPET